MNIIEKFRHWKRKHRWNRQYKSGRWEKLKSTRESGRYKTIVTFSELYGNKNPDILDLGSGEGVLLDYYNTDSISSFHGIDFSSVSIEKANSSNRAKATFSCEDLHDYKPTSNYDIIVFNEAFYYIHESKKQDVLDTIKKHLKPNGIIIVSIFREGLGCWEYFKNNNFIELDFTTVTTDEEKTYWKIGAYKLA